MVGTLTLVSDGEGLLGCWFENDRHLVYGITGPAERHPRISLEPQRTGRNGQLHKTRPQERSPVWKSVEDRCAANFTPTRSSREAWG